MPHMALFYHSWAWGIDLALEFLVETSDITLRFHSTTEQCDTIATIMPFKGQKNFELCPLLLKSLSQAKFVSPSR